MASNISLINFYKVCRICLLEKLNMHSIFEACIPNMIMSFTTVKIGEKDGLPQKICNQCLQQVNRNFTFKQLCEKSDCTLRKFITQNTEIQSDNYTLHLNNNFTEKPENIIAFEGSENVDNDTKQKEVSKQTILKEEERKIEKFKCITCNKVFETRWKLNAHMRGHTGQGIYVCPICDKHCSIPSLLKKHMKIHTAGRKETILQRRQMQNKPFHCQICDKTFLALVTLKKHTKEQHFGQKRVYEKKHMCSTCGKKFCNSSWLEIHQRSHTGERPLSCEVCGKNFALPSSLSKHRALHRPPAHRCSECGRNFTQLHQLRVHELSTHSGLRPFVCSVCGRSTTTRHTLTVHMRTHTGEKPYKCTQCTAAFISRSQLTVHARRHSGLKPYKCTQCDRSFLQKGDLNTHMRYHTGERPYACQICNKRYFAHSALRVHLMSHNGVKPHACPLCHKRFVSSHVLKTHLRVHTGEKPYSCEICGHKFTQSGALSAHMKGHVKN